MSEHDTLHNFEKYGLPILCTAFVGGVVLLCATPEAEISDKEVRYHPDYGLLEERYALLEERYALLEERYASLEDALAIEVDFLRECTNALRRPLDALQRPLGDAGDAREERVSGVDTAPLDASRVPLAPALGGGYKWGNRVKLDLQTPERNPDEGTFRVSMTPNQDGISVEYEVGL